MTLMFNQVNIKISNKQNERFRLKNYILKKQKMNKKCTQAKILKHNPKPE